MRLIVGISGEAMADHLYAYKDQAAKISSGSFQVDGMIVAPCSMKSLAKRWAGMKENRQQQGEL